MTDLEEDDGTMSVLERWAIEEFNTATKSGDPQKYFKESIDEVVKTFRFPNYARKAIDDFTTDRYIYHRRHKELDKEKAGVETVIDTYQYLLELKNNYELHQQSRVFKDYWRKK